MAVGDINQGRRVDATPATERNQYPYPTLKAWDYGKDIDGVWYCIVGNGLVGNLWKHHITEHDDGTITVSPSILISAGDLASWHGYLERGVWREA